MTANEDQIKFWNEKAGRDWTELQARMDRNLSGAHAAIMAWAAPKPGDAVLDIGCGTGTTSMVLADAVGADGSVTGVDISRPMLDLAKSRATGRANVGFELADASAHVFTQQYDLLFSRFGVMFFDDPIGAFANLHRALKPGGHLAFICWRTPPENPWASAPLAAARPLLPEQPAPDPFAPGPFAFSDPQRVLSILTDVGFHDVEIEKFDGVMPMGRDLDVTAEQTLQIGPLSRAVGEADADTRAKIVTAARTTLAAFADKDGEIALPVACWLVRARTAR
jgi:SAM-dependent methyltransferase